MIAMRKSTALCDLARKHKTDKGGRHLTYGNHTTEMCHEYTPAYDFLLWPFRDTFTRVLEIGVNQGCSLRMWEEYFPNAMIYGLDIDPDCTFKTGRIECIVADQSSPMSLHAAIDWIGDKPFDLIIDDGSHIMEHQIISMLALLPYLAAQGFYVIEDIASPEQLELIRALIPKGFRGGAIECPGGLGKARQDEALLVITHG